MEKLKEFWDQWKNKPLFWFAVGCVLLVLFAIGSG